MARTIDEMAAAHWGTLLDHADTIGFFTRPEPQRPAPGTRVFHITTPSGDRSRELAVNDPFEAPDLAILIRLTRRALRDRLVPMPDMLNEQQLEAIRTALVRDSTDDDATWTGRLIRRPGCPTESPNRKQDHHGIKTGASGSCNKGHTPRYG